MWKLTSFFCSRDLSLSFHFLSCHPLITTYGFVLVIDVFLFLFFTVTTRQTSKILLFSRLHSFFISDSCSTPKATRNFLPGRLGPGLKRWKTRYLNLREKLSVSFSLHHPQCLFLRRNALYCFIPRYLQSKCSIWRGTRI
jgi:hypothetical protein